MADTLTRMLRAAGAALLDSLTSPTRARGRSGTARTSGGTGRGGTAGRSERGHQGAADCAHGNASPHSTPYTPSGVREVPVSEALAHTSYSPSPDGDADPGEVVWTWVPFQEDPTRGKDRPVVILGRAGQGVYAVQMTSKDHDRDAEQEARNGRHWLDIGAGAWDAQGRPSEVRLDRALWVPTQGVRREGAVLPRPTFDRIVAGLRTLAGGAGSGNARGGA